MGVSTTIRIMGLAGGVPSPLDGQWLVDYDPTRPGRLPDGRPLRAYLRCTPVQALARVFASASEAFDYVRRDTGMVRPGGAPDRPITAFTLVFEPAGEASILDRIGDGS